MSYQVLARKWRPRNFAEMVGQEHVLRALINALDRDRVHHAFLFTGTRGVGKTTLARILAKSLNCEQGVGSTPCGACSACQEIDQGRFVDLLEVDAASRTKVEDTRDLLDNVQYAPTRGRFKVYLIDEVHMLSNHSFNALLKTLEEPPPHVKFLLATTDPQKLPVTILSRCLQFNLKRLPVRLITDHLQKILQAEQVEYESGALAAIARAADGSMRDALSLLDQAIAHGGGRLQVSDVDDMLGTIDQRHVQELLQALIAGDGQQLLERVQQLAERAPDYGSVLADLLHWLHRMALVQAVPDCLDEYDSDAGAVRALAEAVAPEDVQLFYQIGLIGRRDLPLAPDPRAGLEMVLLRMLAFRPLPPVARSAGDGRRTQAPSPRSVPAQPASSSAPSASAPSASAPSASAPAGGQVPGRSVAATAAGDDWGATVEQLGLRGVARELAVHCVLQEYAGHKLSLVLAPSYEQLASDNARRRLQEALQRYHDDADLRVDIQIGASATETPAQQRERRTEQRHADAVQAIQDDALVRDMQNIFNAEVRPEWVQAVEPSDAKPAGNGEG